MVRRVVLALVAACVGLAGVTLPAQAATATAVSGWATTATSGAVGYVIKDAVSVKTGTGYVARSVSVQRRPSTSITWSTVATGTTSSAGAYTAAYTVPGTGVWYFRLYCEGDEHGGVGDHGLAEGHWDHRGDHGGVGVGDHRDQWRGGVRRSRTRCRSRPAPGTWPGRSVCSGDRRRRPPGRRWRRGRPECGGVHGQLRGAGYGGVVLPVVRAGDRDGRGQGDGLAQGHRDHRGDHDGVRLGDHLGQCARWGTSSRTRCRSRPAPGTLPDRSVCSGARRRRPPGRR